MKSGFTPPAWNDEARISCQFTYKCPKRWDSFQRTEDPTIRHCEDCDRSVHLVYTEKDFQQMALTGQCVAVQLVEGEGLILGGLGMNYEPSKEQRKV